MESDHKTQWREDARNAFFEYYAAIMELFGGSERDREDLKSLMIELRDSMYNSDVASAVTLQPYLDRIGEKLQDSDHVLYARQVAMDRVEAARFQLELSETIETWRIKEKRWLTDKQAFREVQAVLVLFGNSLPVLLGDDWDGQLDTWADHSPLRQPSMRSNYLMRDVLVEWLEMVMSDHRQATLTF